MQIFTVPVTLKKGILCPPFLLLGYLDKYVKIFYKSFVILVLIFDTRYCLSTHMKSCEICPLREVKQLFKKIVMEK